MQPPDPHLHHQLGCCIPAAQCLFHECTYTLLIRSSLKVPLPARCTVTALLLSGLPTRARFLEGGFAPFKSLHMADIGGAPTSGLRPRRGQNQPFRRTRRVLCGLSSPVLSCGVLLPSSSITCCLYCCLVDSSDAGQLGQKLCSLISVISDEKSL